MNDGSNGFTVQRVVLCWNVSFYVATCRTAAARSNCCQDAPSRSSANAPRMRRTSCAHPYSALHVLEAQGVCLTCRVVPLMLKLPQWIKISAGMIHASLIRLCSASVPPKQTMRTAPVAFGGSHTCPTGRPPTSAPCISHAGGSPVSSAVPVRPSPGVRTRAEVPACR